MDELLEYRFKKLEVLITYMAALGNVAMAALCILASMAFDAYLFETVGMAAGFWIGSVLLWTFAKAGQDDGYCRAAWGLVIDFDYPAVTDWSNDLEEAGVFSHYGGDAHE